MQCNATWMDADNHIKKSKSMWQGQTQDVFSKLQSIEYPIQAMVGSKCGQSTDFRLQKENVKEGEKWREEARRGVMGISVRGHGPAMMQKL